MILDGIILHTRQKFNYPLDVPIHDLRALTFIRMGPDTSRHPKRLSNLVYHPAWSISSMMRNRKEECPFLVDAKDFWFHRWIEDDIKQRNEWTIKSEQMDEKIIGWLKDGCKMEIEVNRFFRISAIGQQKWDNIAASFVTWHLQCRSSCVPIHSIDLKI